MSKVQHCKATNKVPRKRPYMCDMCFKQFETPSKLARHYLIHTGQKPYSCHVCHKTFRQMVHLERHQLTHTLPFQCDICFRSFKNLVTFLKHQQLHNENCPIDPKPVKKAEAQPERSVCAQPVHCPDCQQSFSTQEKWVLHQCSPPAHPHSVSRRPKALKCETCNKPFPSRSKLERHLLIHTGQRPFACSLCVKSFRQKTHLAIHQLTHIKEKPFQCNLCYKSFKLQSKLMKHKEVHAHSLAYANGLCKPQSARADPAAAQNLMEDKTEVMATDSTCEQDSEDVCSIYVVPFQCTVCERCFETEHILRMHTCFIEGDGRASNTLKRNSSYRTNRRRNRVSKKLKCSAVQTSNTHLTGRNRLKSYRFKSQEQPSSGEQSCSNYGTLQKTAKKSKPPGTLKTYKAEAGQRQGSRTHCWSKQLHSHELGINMQGLLRAESRLGEHDSVDRNIVFVQNGDEVFAYPKVAQDHYSAPPRNIYSRHKTFHCDQCEKAFPSLSKLKRHYLTHTGQRPFSCDLCGKMFRQSAHLKRHQITHTEKMTYQIPVCQVEFQDLNMFFDQQKEQLELKTSQHIGYSSNTLQPPAFQEYEMLPSDPVPEIKVELGGPDFSLDMSCSNTQAYLSNNGSVEAKPTHRGPRYNHSRGMERSKAPKRMYQCTVCLKSFKSPSKLERHYLMHAGQKPFECPVCFKTFRQTPHLKRHMLTHSKQMAC
ncbi:zinc finger protein 770 [Rhinatrema bivittatum]|uniref:zinc finger protein 770 n=1 Tax=Rhinatrema bivittatum TaxID=194408 RepID=UPI00112708BF|nr:zinc finger protein 770 [Rhinatrema bivittatum]XP_029456074.1 zinc finger protein 770 [Rhinatrema bivittatum]XP_029456075.1 zinc finger protein 770 [Rhinatrema bivittatum]XP_029456076.1 zinc finger protein 770 [Rhinatrema bivittatum]XP_029456078.1 zinc finger protein 770 [Rhinatrema bivittatum]XP_029456079.1 zinc finger protein 770 [Rhinatrema bivittatum]XP_029456080.1 zinc finger protein 770 [Rhinatrema bivittatum]XP_029456081.1 zinc finger protein 770 [Rhinatrema bivittatum]XP_02945608